MTRFFGRNMQAAITMLVVLFSVVSVQSFVSQSSMVRPAFASLSPAVASRSQLVPLGMAQAIDETTPLASTPNMVQRQLDILTGGDYQGWLNKGVMILIAVGVLAKVSLLDVNMMRGWTAEELALRTAADNWSSYYDVLTAAPIQTKAVTSATVYTIGDVIAQSTEGKSMGELDRPRIVRSLLAGLIGHGPLSHYWYQYSELFFNDVLGWTAWWSFFPKVMVDQLSWGPFWNNSYIVMLGLMKRDNLETIWSEIKRTTIPLVVSGLKLWPLAHCITYGVIPVENRLLWVDMVEILWVTILATQAAGGALKEEPVVDVPLSEVTQQEFADLELVNEHNLLVNPNNATEGFVPV